MSGKKGCQEGFIQGSGLSELTDVGGGGRWWQSPFPLPGHTQASPPLRSALVVCYQRHLVASSENLQKYCLGLHFLPGTSLPGPSFCRLCLSFTCSHMPFPSKLGPDVSLPPFHLLCFSPCPFIPFTRDHLHGVPQGGYMNRASTSKPSL